MTPDISKKSKRHLFCFSALLKTAGWCFASTLKETLSALNRDSGVFKHARTGSNERSAAAVLASRPQSGPSEVRRRPPRSAVTAC